MKILNRYGEKIVMIYDADNAGQAAMKRGIDIALAQGMEVQLLELPDGEDPDSFVKQFGKESFEDKKNQEALDFVDFLLHKADEEGRLQNPVQVGKVITEILQAIASIKESIQRQIYVQHLHQKTQKYRKGSDRELFVELERVMAQKRNEDFRDRRREEFQESRRMDIPEEALGRVEHSGQQGNPNVQQEKPSTKKTQAEKELIRLMITYGKDMVEYICSFTNDNVFEDEELKAFYLDILNRFKEEEEISVNVYSGKNEPYPRLVGDILLEQYTPSERHQEKVGLKYERDKNPYRTAKSTIKTLELAFLKRKLAELSERFGRSESQEEKKKIMTSQTKIQEKVNKLSSTYSDDYYPDPHSESENVVNEKKFEYKMKSERNQ